MVFVNVKILPNIIAIYFIIIASQWVTATKDFVPATYGTPDFMIKTWEFNTESSPPAYLMINETILHNKPGIVLFATEIIREDFYLTALANPFIKNESECPEPRMFKNSVVRDKFVKFHETYRFFKDDTHLPGYSFGNIFTGCYYFVMTNENGTNWVLGPEFYNTTYRYVNTEIELVLAGFDNRNEELITEVVTTVKVPFECIEIMARLYEVEGNISNVIGAIENGSIPSSQVCKLNMVEGKPHSECAISVLATKLDLSADGDKEKARDEWSVNIKWQKLKKSGGTYAIRYTKYIESCITVGKCSNTTNICTDYSDYYTWLPLNENYTHFLGYPDSGIPYISQTTGPYYWLSIICGVVSIIAVILLFYWIKKYPRQSLDENSTDKQLEIQQKLCEKESSKILLLYMKSDQIFMNEIDRLKYCLKQNCSNFQVHDVYAIDDWGRVNALGVAGWIQEMLKDGCKVIWIDTPEFRSYVNSQPNENTDSDFRDDAIRFAITVVIESYQNAATQYCRHFVVRVKGFDVPDGDDDPLQVITPYARYSIPDQLLLLCEHLQTPMISYKDTNITLEL